MNAHQDHPYDYLTNHHMFSVVILHIRVQQGHTEKSLVIEMISQYLSFLSGKKKNWNKILRLNIYGVWVLLGHTREVLTWVVSIGDFNHRRFYQR
jgi:hypothetical protein